jgi:4-hydroxyphenylpyruvate dioxygenase
MVNNPLNLDGLEFIEFASPDRAVLDLMMDRLGMVEVAAEPKNKTRLFRQGHVTFLTTERESSFAVEFSRAHGPAACSTGFRVKDAKFAFEEAIRRGAEPFTDESRKTFALPAIKGIGGSLVYFVDRYGSRGDIYSESFHFLGPERHPKGRGLEIIDHMTNNVPQGEMNKWCHFYESIFGFEEKRYFDIRGKSTGLLSKVMWSPCGKFAIPINEPTDPKSQIQEYLNEYKGSGIQHIALTTQDIAQSVTSLRKAGIQFLAAPPTTYYEKLPQRLPQATENMRVMQDLAILLDGDEKGYLLQIFTQNQVGPIFIEVIQRKGHDGFGEGNFQALFDAMEEDQRRRGVL